MARTTGSDELYRLIHSLTTEEKGYFKKFAKRHTSSGNNYLLLFNEINRQKDFEEVSLKKRFKDYAVIKAYLKEMITDSLLLYHRNSHPHINLLSQIQKAQLLLMKGLRAESLKVVAKSIKDSSELQSFLLSSYLLRMQMNVQRNLLTTPASINEFVKQYQEEMKDQAAQETDLLEWELISLNAFQRYRATDVFNAGQTKKETRNIKKKQVKSKRSKVVKLSSLFELYSAEMNQKELFNSAKELLEVATDFKQTADASFDTIPAINNYLLTLGNYGKFEETISICDNLLHEKSSDQHYYNVLLVRCLIYKAGALIHLGRFEQALDVVTSSKKAFDEAIKRTQDSTKQRVFALHVVIILFLNKKYRDTWLAIQNLNQKSILKNYIIGYADLKMVELMTQWMLGNFELAKSMAVKYKKEFDVHGIKSFTYQILLSFFIQLPSGNHKQQAKKALETLNDYYSSKNKFHRKVFAQLRYTYWLEEISGGRTIRQLLAEQFGNE